MRLEGELDRHEIRVAVDVHQMVKQYALLQRRQWIDVLNICGAAGNRSNDAIDLRSRKARERHHFRRNFVAVARDEIWRNRHIGPNARGARQSSRSRRDKKHSSVGAHAVPAQLIDDANRFQRVTAELEEIVVDADALDAENSCEDAAQRLFRRRARRDIIMALSRIWIRIRQRLAVELATGRQRHRFQLDKQPRDHIVRQISS